MHAIGLALGVELRKKKCPTPVVDGPEPAKAIPTHERIVIEETDDTFAPPRGQHRLTKHRMTRVVGGRIRIHAQSTAAGASVWEHRDRGERLLQAVLTSLEIVATKWRVSWTPKGGRFVEPELVEGSAVPPGALYELAFTFEHAIVDVTFAGEERPTVTVGSSGLGIKSCTKVSRAGAPDTDPTTVPDDADTACGDC